ncbi:DUF3027 domain-containing protein [Corynebacterium sp. zg-331]|uniref:DUF3027 domain-containing protein n=1 Tax=unclassified Corynebacterium TaxID=2624378 RepID=UPI00128D3D75|nr:DUF3027 domain-containing protein [Corynebacterium sp. zg-331]MPV52913.1 DUF3027 domain-containing protein [Corynebacterium sp. zg331]
MGFVPTQRYGKKDRVKNPLFSRQATAVAAEALVELGEEVGDHVGVQPVDRHAAIHRFAADLPGYTGWEWQVAVACAPGSRRVTVNEVSLVPAPHGEALQAPEWVPWAQRIQPGDLHPGDLMPPEPDDRRLTKTDRGHELSVEGLREAWQRWRTGDFGPTSEFAEKAALHCGNCAFYLRIGEQWGKNFGVCANEYSADGHLVHSSYGCGAHSETPRESSGPTARAFDDERPIF